MLNTILRDGFRDALSLVNESPAVNATYALEDDPARAGAWQVPVILHADAQAVLEQPDVLFRECFGPATLLVSYADTSQLLSALAVMPGSLTATLHAEDGEDVEAMVATMSRKVGRILFAGWPTGVAVTWAQHHGGPYPATTDPLHTSVGAASLARFQRPMAFQDAPQRLLPEELRDPNPHRIPRRVNGELTRHPVIPAPDTKIRS